MYNLTRRDEILRGPIVGWDIGGANIKAARINHEGGLEVVEVPFALWRAPDRLTAILKHTAGRVGPASTMAVTMTAELADCFATKREGVRFVLDAFSSAFPAEESWVFATDGRFCSIAAARANPDSVAAANWVATAMMVSRHFSEALIVDVGSTTTDVIPIIAGRVAAAGRTDTDRLRAGELVYTGALRTPVAAIVRHLPVHGRQCRVASEYFAIAADAHLWRRSIDARDYTCETPDGRGRERRDAGARLARMVCADLDVLSDAEITAIADHVSGMQVRQISAAIRAVLSRWPRGARPVGVLAGQGKFLAQAAAEANGLSVHDLADDFGAAAARAAPAAAVACLLQEMSATELLRE